MITTIQPALSRCSFLEALASALQDHGDPRGRDVLRGQTAPMALRLARGRADALTAILAGEWAPDILGACGVPEDVSGALRMMGSSVESMGPTLAEAFAEVHDVDASASCSDYTAHRALNDARWVIDCACVAVSCCDVAEERISDGDIKGAVECYEHAALMIAKAAVNRTAPKTKELIQWIKEEVG